MAAAVTVAALDGCTTRMTEVEVEEEGDKEVGEGVGDGTVGEEEMFWCSAVDVMLESSGGSAAMRQTAQHISLTYCNLMHLPDNISSTSAVFKHGSSLH